MDPECDYEVIPYRTLIVRAYVLEANLFFEILVIRLLFQFNVFIPRNSTIHSHVQVVCCNGVIELGAINKDRIWTKSFVC